jgi:hypothetical protein
MGALGLDGLDGDGALEVLTHVSRGHPVTCTDIEEQRATRELLNECLQVLMGYGFLVRARQEQFECPTVIFPRHVQDPDRSGEIQPAFHGSPAFTNLDRV